MPHAMESQLTIEAPAASLGGLGTVPRDAHPHAAAADGAVAPDADAPAAPPAEAADAPPPAAPAPASPAAGARESDGGGATAPSVRAGQPSHECCSAIFGKMKEGVRGLETAHRAVLAQALAGRAIDWV